MILWMLVLNCYIIREIERREKLAIIYIWFNFLPVGSWSL